MSDYCKDGSATDMIALCFESFKVNKRLQEQIMSCLASGIYYQCLSQVFNKTLHESVCGPPFRLAGGSLAHIKAASCRYSLPIHDGRTETGRLCLGTASVEEIFRVEMD